MSDSDHDPADDECDRCGHMRARHNSAGNCGAQVGTCGDGCCVYLCDCSEFKEVK